MFCMKCGKILPEDARFCPYCGAEAFHSENEGLQSPSNGAVPQEPAAQGNSDPYPQNPYFAPQNPYAQGGQNPYASAPQGAQPNPYAQGGQNPYASAPQSAQPNPYAQGGQYNPYAQAPYANDFFPAANPYDPSAANPYLERNPYLPRAGSSGVTAHVGGKTRITAAMLGVCFGMVGANLYYLRRYFLGVISTLVFLVGFFVATAYAVNPSLTIGIFGKPLSRTSWTYGIALCVLPYLLNLICGICYLKMTDETFLRAMKSPKKSYPKEDIR